MRTRTDATRQPQHIQSFAKTSESEKIDCCLESKKVALLSDHASYNVHSRFRIKNAGLAKCRNFWQNKLDKNGHAGKLELSYKFDFEFNVEFEIRHSFEPQMQGRSATSGETVLQAGRYATWSENQNSFSSDRGLLRVSKVKWITFFTVFLFFYYFFKRAVSRNVNSLRLHPNIAMDKRKNHLLR